VGKLSTTVLNFGAVSPAIAQNLRNPQMHQWNSGSSTISQGSWLSILCRHQG